MIKINEIKTITALALPLIAAFLAQKGMQFIDTFMMGWIGPDALAAGALGTSIFMTVLLFCMGTLSAAGIFIARAKGASDDKDIKASLQHGLCLAIFLSLPCMFIIRFSPHVLSSLGQDQVVIDQTILLLNGLAWGLPGYLLFMVLREYIATFSLTRIVMLVAFSSMPLTFAANYILIYGLFGFPRSGIAGIGYASALVMWYMFFCLYFYSKNHILLNKYISFKQFQFNKQKIIDMLYIGVPSGLLFVLEAGMFLVAAILMGYLGVDALAAHQIAMQCMGLAYSIPFALSMATALQIGHAAGMKDNLKAKQIAYHSLLIGLIITASIALIFIFAADHLISIFINSDESNFQEIRKLAVSFLYCAAAFQCFDGVQAIANGALRGLKDTLVPMLLSIGCYWILGVGSAYYFALHTELKSLGVWYGLTLGLMSIGVILLIRLVRKLNAF